MNSFTYLGSKITSDQKCTTDIICRIAGVLQEEKAIHHKIVKQKDQKNTYKTIVSI